MNAYHNLVYVLAQYGYTRKMYLYIYSIYIYIYTYPEVGRCTLKTGGVAVPAQKTDATARGVSQKYEPLPSFIEVATRISTNRVISLN